MKLAFPREVTAVHQLEISSRCSLRCIYCPSHLITAGKMPNRPALDMKMEIFERAMEWVAFHVHNGTQDEINLAGIGESVLNPLFPEFIRLTREAVGPSVKIIYATNGIPCEEEFVKKIAPYNPRVWVSLHRPEKAGPAIELYRKYGLLDGASADPSISANDWAGQIKWFNSGLTLQCQWMGKGRVMVMADGRITSCCLDASGIGVIGHVNDPIGSVKTKPYSLCKSCYQAIEADNWDQEKGESR